MSYININRLKIFIVTSFLIILFFLMNISILRDIVALYIKIFITFSIWYFLAPFNCLVMEIFTFKYFHKKGINFKEKKTTKFIPFQCKIFNVTCNHKNIFPDLAVSTCDLISYTLSWNKKKHPSLARQISSITFKFCQ